MFFNRPRLRPLQKRYPWRCYVLETLRAYQAQVVDDFNSAKGQVRNRAAQRLATTFAFEDLLIEEDHRLHDIGRCIDEVIR